jgi:hypothetical protein
VESKKKKESMNFRKYYSLIVFTLGIFLLFTFFWFLGIIKNPFLKKELRIEDTNVLVDDIKVISQLFTSSYYTEIVVDSVKKVPGVFSDYTYQLVIVARGTAYVGTELSNLDTSNIKVNKVGDKLECTLTIPPARIFNTVVNPSGFSIFIDNKNFTPEEVQATKDKALRKIELSAIESGILQKANERSTKLFQDLLLGMGFSKVIINIK